MDENTPVTAAAAAAIQDTPLNVPEEQEVKQSHLMILAELRFAYQVEQSEQTRQAMLAIIKEQKMAPYYSHCCTTFGWSQDAALLEELKQKNQDDVKAMDDKVADAEKNAGETEVRDALFAKAEYYSAIGDQENTFPALEVALKKTVGSGPKIDVLFAAVKFAFFLGDRALIKQKLDEVKKSVEDGGDWDRRNRYKVFSALYNLLSRDFVTASKLLIENIATFSSTDLLPYSTFVFYAVVMAMVATDRNTLREKVIKSPEIISTIKEVPHLQPFLHSLYHCKYSEFFPSLVSIMDIVQKDRFLSVHSRYLNKELRLVAYTQFLESYKSVTLHSMANAFGISAPLLDQDLAKFIYAGRLSAKIDRVSGVVETSRPDSRNSQYANLIKQGDALLNRVQKLSRVISY